MSTKAQFIKCSNCGADVQCEEGREKIFCSYCGAAISLKNENEKIYRYIDEAEVTRAENEKIIELKKLSLKEKNDVVHDRLLFLKIRISVVLGVVGMIFLIVGIFIEGDSGVAVLELGVIFICMIIWVWILIRPSNNQEASNSNLVISSSHMSNNKSKENPVGEEDGYSTLPDKVFDFESMKYDVICALLESEGFTNIVCIPLGDMEDGIFSNPRKENKVESIRINKKDLYDCDYGDSFLSNTKIIISYHSY